MSESPLTRRGAKLPEYGAGGGIGVTLRPMSETRISPQGRAATEAALSGRKTTITRANDAVAKAAEATPMNIAGKKNVQNSRESADPLGEKDKKRRKKVAAFLAKAGVR